MKKISSKLSGLIHTNEIREAHLNTTNDFLARNINPALALGDMNYLLMELDWIKILLINYNVPVEQLTEYWQFYHQALNRNQDE